MTRHIVSSYPSPPTGRPTSTTHISICRAKSKGEGTARVRSGVIPDSPDQNEKSPDSVSVAELSTIFSGSSRSRTSRTISAAATGMLVRDSPSPQ